MFNRKKLNVRVLDLTFPIIRKEFMESSAVALLRTLDEILYPNKKEIKGILLHIDSPGGGAGLSEEIARTLIEIKKKRNIPIVASIEGSCFSGAYLTACTADRIYANRMSWVGSVGAIMTLPNFTKLAEKVGASFITIKSGEMKDLGNYYREMTAEEKEYLEKLVKSTHDEFIDFVLSYRDITNVDLFDGRIMDSHSAKIENFIDELGTFQDALTYLIEEKMGKKREDVEVINQDSRFGIKQILSSFLEGFDLSGIISSYFQSGIKH